MKVIVSCAEVCFSYEVVVAKQHKAIMIILSVIYLIILVVGGGA